MIFDLFNNYYDTVEYKKKTGIDRSGNAVYSDPVQMQVRFVSGGETLYIEKTGTTIKFTREYQVPVETIDVDDLLDGRKVVNIIPSRGIDGHFHFMNVYVL